MSSTGLGFEPAQIYQEQVNPQKGTQFSNVHQKKLAEMFLYTSRWVLRHIPFQTLKFPEEICGFCPRDQAFLAGERRRRLAFIRICFLEFEDAGRIPECFRVQEIKRWLSIF